MERLKQDEKRTMQMRETMEMRFVCLDIFCIPSTSFSRHMDINSTHLWLQSNKSLKAIFNVQFFF